VLKKFFVCEVVIIEHGPIDVKKRAIDFGARLGE
jgi:hypothetical protein